MMPGTLKFTALAVSCYIEDDVCIVGIGDDPVAPERYIIITRFDDGIIDESIGISTDVSGDELSNAVEAIVLRKSEICIYIKPGKIEEAGGSIFCADIDSANFDFDVLIDYVNKIFTGSSTQVSIQR